MKKSFLQAIAHPLINFAFGILGSSSLLLSPDWFIKLISLVFIPFTLIAYLDYRDKKPPIMRNLSAGLFILLCGLITITALVNEIQIRPTITPLMIVVIVSEITTAAVFFFIGIRQLGLIGNSKKK